MGGFPAPFSAANPYVGAAGDFASGAAHLAASLRAAADQMAYQKQQEADKKAADYQKGLKDALDERLKLEDKGFVPNQVYPNGAPPPGRPTLQTPEANPDAQQGGQTMTDSQGNQYSLRMYTPKGALAEAFHKYLGVDGDIPARDLPHHLQALHDAEVSDERNGPEEMEPFPGKFVGPDGKPAQLMRGKRTGKITAGALPDGYSPAPDKEPAPKALHWEKETDDNGNVTLRALDAETGDEVRTFTYKGVGQKRKDPDAPAIPKPPSAAQLRVIEKTKNDRIAAARKAYSKALEEALTPEDKAAAGRDLIDSYKSAQSEYETTLSDVTGKDVGHNDWADRMQTPSAPATTAPAQSAPPAPSLRQRLFGGGSASQTAGQPAQPPQPTRQSTDQPSGNAPRSATPAQRTNPPTSPAAAPGPGGQQARPKTVSMAQLKAYVNEQKRRGNLRFTLDDANREAKQKGIKVIGATANPAHASAASSGN
jgi:hypothetical protein